MNLEKLQEEIAADEGCVLEIYNDHLGYATFGIGHLITEDDPEHGEELGTEISQERVDECFLKDVDTVIADCHILYPEFDELPEEVQHIIANMMFNMGRPRLSKFKNMKQAILDRNWARAADEMVDSSWYNQVTNRAERLVDRMRSPR